MTCSKFVRILNQDMVGVVSLATCMLSTNHSKHLLIKISKRPLFSRICLTKSNCNLAQFEYIQKNYEQVSLNKKWDFPLRISQVNVTKSTGNCGFPEDILIGKPHFLYSVSRPVQTYKYMFYKPRACFITKNKVSKSFSVAELSLSVCAS